MTHKLQKVEVEIKGIVGVAKPFRQGGVWRLTIPKRVVERHDLKIKTKREFFSYIFLETNRGLLLFPLEKVVNPETLREALRFVDTSGISDEDLEILFEETEE